MKTLQSQQSFCTVFEATYSKYIEKTSQQLMLFARIGNYWWWSIELFLKFWKHCLGAPCLTWRNLILNSNTSVLSQLKSRCKVVLYCCKALFSHLQAFLGWLQTIHKCSCRKKHFSTGLTTQNTQAFSYLSESYRITWHSIPGSPLKPNRFL